MGTWNSRGLRGSTLEELINISNEQYQNNNLALIQKIPTPITPVRIDQETRHITLAYFDSKSTVDYIGVVQGIPVCFDAKESATTTVPLNNIHEHQMKFMEVFEKQDGIAFIILYFSKLQEAYYIPFVKVKEFYDRSKNGGRKSFKLDELDRNFLIGKMPGVPIHYLESIQKDLNKR